MDNKKAAFYYHAHRRSKAKRMIVMHQNTALRPKAAGKTLFTDEQLGEAWRYGAMVTDITDLPPVQIWTKYCGRADAENRIKELKMSVALKKKRK